MLFNVSIAMNWILFLALFPIAFFWLRRAWRILVRGDYSEVALKRGEPPANAAKYAPYAAAINLVAGVVAGHHGNRVHGHRLAGRRQHRKLHPHGAALRFQGKQKVLL